MSAIDCTFNTVWDGGFVISTSAKFDAETGLVSDIAQVDPVDDDGVEVEVLEREYVEFEGVSEAFDVEPGVKTNEFRVKDIEAVRAALASSPRP